MNKKIIITAAGIFGSALMWLVSFKIVAMLLGPSGVGIYSQLRQIIQATGTASTFGGGNSIVQGLSENHDPQYRKRFRVTITLIVLGISSFIALITIAFAPLIAKHMLSSGSKESVASIQLLSVGIFLNAGSMFLMSILNGYQSLKSLAIVQLSAPLFIVIMLLSAPFTNGMNSTIMLASLFVIGSLFSFIFALLANRKIVNDSKLLDHKFLSKKETLGFVKFSASTLLAALASSLTLLFLRSKIISSYGIHQAGLFDASWTLTFNYITLFLTACSIFYLPRLSQAETKKKQMYYLQCTTYIVIACVTIITYTIVIFKSQLLHLLYSEQFYSAEKSLHILAGAILIRSVSWVLSMLLMATKDSVLLLVSELFFNALLIVFTYLATRHYLAIDMVAWGLFYANLIYFLWIYYCVKQKNKLFESKLTLILLFMGVFFIVVLFLIEQSEVVVVSGYISSFMQKIVFFCIALTISGASWRAFRKFDAKTKLSYIL